MTEHYISIEHCISFYNLTSEFFNELELAGLIQVSVFDGKRMLPHEQIVNVEQYARWFDELDINIPGIEVIHHLLERIDYLHEENQKLYNENKFFKARLTDGIDEIEG